MGIIKQDGKVVTCPKCKCEDILCIKPMPEMDLIECQLCNQTFYIESRIAFEKRKRMEADCSKLKALVIKANIQGYKSLTEHEIKFMLTCCCLSHDEHCDCGEELEGVLNHGNKNLS